MTSPLLAQRRACVVHICFPMRDSRPVTGRPGSARREREPTPQKQQRAQFPQRRLSAGPGPSPVALSAASESPGPHAQFELRDSGHTSPSPAPFKFRRNAAGHGRGIRARDSELPGRGSEDSDRGLPRHGLTRPAVGGGWPPAVGRPARTETAA